MKLFLAFSFFLAAATVRAQPPEKPEPTCDDKAPVCGEDGMTYDNECDAVKGEVEVLRRGHCPPTHALKPKGKSKKKKSGGIPAKFGRLDKSEFGEDVADVKVLSFQGFKGANILKFDKKKVSVPTSPALNSKKEEEEAVLKEQRGTSNINEKDELNGPSSRSKAWFGELQGKGNGNGKGKGKGKKGFATANILQDEDGHIIGSFNDENGDIYHVQTITDENGDHDLRVVMIQTKDIPPEDDYDENEEGFEGGNDEDISPEDEKDEDISPEGDNDENISPEGDNDEDISPEDDSRGRSLNMLRGSSTTSSTEEQDDVHRQLAIAGDLCEDVPGWHDSSGHYWDCDKYASDPTYYCSTYGDGWAFGGYTANQACCACGGGGYCVDRPGWYGQWHDSDGATYNCAWYGASADRCESYGDRYDNFGYTAKEACCACGGGGAGTIDIMVVYTNGARDAEDPNDERAIQRLAALAVQETNVAFELSGISARLRLVKTMRDTSDYDESGKNTATVLTELTDTDSPLNHHTMRDTVGADIVVLLTEDSCCGRASSIGSQIYTNLVGFAVVERIKASGYFTFAHEVGHLLNARHNSGADSTPGSNHGYGDPSDEFRSIMSYPSACTDTCPRIQRYSNLMYEFENEPIGDTSEDNAKAIQAFARTTSLYKPTKTTCSVTYQHWIGDGYCDRYGEYNTEACGWDGGDCCTETCVPTATYKCTNTKSCQDPKVMAGNEITSGTDGNYCVYATTYWWTSTNSVFGAECTSLASDQYQKWIYDRNNQYIKNARTGKCLTFATTTNSYGEAAYDVFTVTCGMTEAALVQEWYEGDNDMIQAGGGVYNKCLTLNRSDNDLVMKDCGSNNNNYNEQEFLFPEQFFN